LIYSRSSDYAIRASLHLAQVPEGKCAFAKDIAQQHDIPAHFLAKILQQLARKGFLVSSKGPAGGFRLSCSANDLRLIDIVDAVEGLHHYGQCIAGNSECSDHAPCPLHDSWTVLHSRIMEYLKRNTIGSLVQQVEAQKQSQCFVPGEQIKACESNQTLRSSL
jgi:Rrf2 family transcriptional regulator, iron-sulfur cluster assembly transcription factor